MSKIQTIICLFIFVVIICSMNVFFGITESFGGGGGGGRYKDIRGNQNTNGGTFFIPRLSMLQDDN
jgi:hypothetical protein